MKYEQFLDDVNVDFAKYYLNIYRTVRKKPAAQAFAERILVDASAMGGVLETMVREGFNPDEIGKFETHLNNMRYVIKVLYKNNYLRRRRTRKFLLAARQLEYFVNDPIEVSKITGKKDRRKIERMLREKYAEDAYNETYTAYMNEAEQAEKEAKKRDSEYESAQRTAASSGSGSGYNSDPDGFDDVYIESGTSN